MFSVKLFLILCLVGTLVAGATLLKNFQRWFGPDPEVPGDGAAGQNYNQMQIIVLWLLTVKLLVLALFLL